MPHITRQEMGNVMVSKQYLMYICTEGDQVITMQLKDVLPLWEKT